ncbi:MAG: hypothetical protein WBM83_03575 [Flavobacteriaceae bacterium]
MKRLKKILLSTATLLLVLCIIGPSVQKLFHSLNVDHSQQCTNKTDVHVHKAELDCDFDKFKLSPQPLPVFVNTFLLIPVLAKEKTESHYFFLSKYQQLHFALRGPPASKFS